MERPKHTDEDEATDLIGGTIAQMLPPGSMFVLIAGMPNALRNPDGSLPVLCISNITDGKLVRKAVEQWLDGTAEDLDSG